MKTRKLVLALVSLLCASSQAQMMIPKPSSVTDFRPIGETRVYTIIVKDSVVGHLKSTIKERTQVNDVRGVTIAQELQLDYTLIGGERKISIQGEHYMSDNGYYLGDKKTITSQGRSERLDFARIGDSITGFFTRGGNRVEQSVDMPANIFAFDNNFFDQLEMIIAMHRLEVGETIEQDIIEPQSLLRSRFKAVVEGFQYMNIHKSLADSVFFINVFEPQPMSLYFSKNRRLLKIELTDQETVVYLDRVSNPPPAPLRPPGMSLRAVLLSIPGYFVNLFFAIAATLFFVGRGYRWKATYIAFLGGGMVFLVIPETQLPLQNLLMGKVFIPAIKSGASPFLYGILPSAAAGLIQEMLKLGVIVGMVRVLPVKSYQYMAIGSVCAAGFGLVEGCYLNTMIGSYSLISLVLVERVSFFLFHATSGALIGMSLAGDRKRLIVVMVTTVLFNTLLRYLPLFVQQQIVELELMYLILAILVLGLLTWALLRSKQIKPSSP